MCEVGGGNCAILAVYDLIKASPQYFPTLTYEFEGKTIKEDSKLPKKEQEAGQIVLPPGAPYYAIFATYPSKVIIKQKHVLNMADEVRQALVGLELTNAMKTISENNKIIKVPDYKSMSLKKQTMIQIPGAMANLPASIGESVIIPKSPSF